MKLTEYKLDETDQTISFVKLSVEEEYAMARWVMDVLCLPWIDTREEFQRFLESIFWRKSRGRDLTVEQAELLCDYYERYQELLPNFPKLKDGRCIQPPSQHKDGSPLTSEERLDFFQWTIRNAWKEVWSIHPHIKTRTKFSIFPDEEPTEDWILKQQNMEKDFWIEVEKQQVEYECSREEAIILVSDYMHRPPIAYQHDGLKS